MTLLALSTWCIGMMCLARFICKNWLNHLTLYTLVWTTSLFAYELHWIRYNSITDESWLYIIVAWISIYLGSAAAMAGSKVPPPKVTVNSLARLRLAIVLLSIGGLISCAVLAIQIMREIDQNLLMAVTVGAPKIYAASFEETGQFTGIPYLGFLPFAAAPLAGVYAASKGRIGWVALLPLIVATITGILSVSRFDMLLSCALFLIALALSPKPHMLSFSRIQKAVLAITCLVGIVFVSLARTDLISSLPDEQPALTSVAEWIPVAPSLYFYVSGPAVGFSEYLQNDIREANSPWGRYTFASVYRFMSKLGLATYVPFHQDFYSTPEPVNTCTFLRELHSDFGVTGLFVVPGILGFAATRLSRNRGNLLALTLLAYLYVVIAFSFTFLVAATGQWFQGLSASVITALLLGCSSRQRSANGVLRAQLLGG